MTPLGVEYGVKYTLTGPDGTVAVFNDSSDPNFVGSLSPESSGLDSPEVREDAQDATEADGGVHGNFFYGRRPVILQGTIGPASSAADRNAKVSKLLRASNAMRGDAVLKWKPAGAAVEVSLPLRRQQAVRLTKGYVKDFFLPLVSATAEIYSVVTSKSSIFVRNSVGASNPGTLAEGATGTVGWTNLANAKTSDNIYTTAALAIAGNTTKAILASNFPFSAIPSGATIVGAKVDIEAKGSGGFYGEVKLLKGGVSSGTNQAAGENLTAADAIQTYGSTNDLWGTTISRAEAIASGFGVEVRFGCAAGVTISVDSISMKANLQLKVSLPPGKLIPVL
jgi:hypothetical protein